METMEYSPISTGTTIRVALRDCVQEYARILELISDQDTVADIWFQLDRLKIWAGNMGVFARDKASADHRMQDDPNSKLVILGVLRRLTQKGFQFEAFSRDAPLLRLQRSTTTKTSSSMISADLELQDEETVESGSDSLDEPEESSGMAVSTKPQELVQTIEQLVDSLFRLASTIRKPIRYQSNTRITQAITRTGPESEQLAELSSHVQFQLKGKQSIQEDSGMPHLSQTLLDRIVDAATFRRQRFIYKKRHASKLSQGVDTAFRDVLGPVLPLRARQPFSSNPSKAPIVDVQKDRALTAKSALGSVVYSATMASSILPQTRRETTEMAPSIVSQSAIVRHKDLDFPPAPKVNHGHDVICPYCLLPQDASILQTKYWRQHVLHDLEPYVCVFENCDDSSKLYSSMDDCMQHMRWSHATVWACNAPGHENAVFTEPAGLEDHLRALHGSAVSTAQLSTIIGKSMRPSDEAFHFCPLCLEPLDKPTTEEERPSDVRIDIVKRFRNHIAKHLEFLALLSLPPRSDVDGDEESQIKQRESMTSVSNVDTSDVNEPEFDESGDPVSAANNDHHAEYSTVIVPDIADDIAPVLVPWRLDENALAPYEDPTLRSFVSRAKTQLLQEATTRWLEQRENHIMIVCCEQTQLQALRHTLDEIDDLPSYHLMQDGDITYMTGRLHSHHVAVAYVDYDQSLVSTAFAAHVQKAFPDVKLFLFVGIGAALPDLTSQSFVVPDKNDVRLGDVVVGYEEPAGSGLVKVRRSDRSDHSTWSGLRTFEPLPDVLCEALIAAGVGQMRGDRSISQFMQSTHPYPGAEHDSLYWSVSGRRTLIGRAQRKVQQPCIHYGVIASASLDVETSYAGDTMREKFNAACVDTKLHACMPVLPSLVIRGIGEYYANTAGENPKLSEWWQYAAVSAAAFTKELLIHLLPSEVASLIAIGRMNIQPESSTVLALNDHLDTIDKLSSTSDMVETDRATHDAFHVVDYEFHKNQVPLRHPLTLRWAPAMYNQHFTVSTTSLILVLLAGPGLGKSVFSRALIERHLPRPSDLYTICYFFFKDIQPLRTIGNALRSIIHQLFIQTAQIPSYVSNMQRYQEAEHPRNSKEDLDALWNLLYDFSKHSKRNRVMVVLDGLDECDIDDAQWLFSHLYTYISESSETDSQARLKFIITCQKHEILDHFLASSDHVTVFHMDDKQVSITDDVMTLAREKLQKLSNSIEISTTLQDLLVDWISEARPLQYGTHQWLQLVIDIIELAWSRGANNPEKNLMSLIPTTLYQAYSSLIDHWLPSVASVAVQIILGMINISRQAPSLSVVSIALNMALSTSTFQSLSEIPIRVVVTEEWLTQRCGQLVYTDGRFIFPKHHTFATWLTSLDLSLRDDMSKMMARICVQFPCLDDFQRTTGRDGLIFEGGQEFLDFAATHWADYVRVVEDTLSETMRSQVDLLYETSGPRFQKFVMQTIESYLGHEVPVDTQMSKIHLAAAHGHVQRLKDYLHTGTFDLASCDSTGRTALIWAAERGWLDVIKVLLGNSELVDLQSRTYGDALVSACKSSFVEGFRFLIEHRPDPRAVPQGARALITAAGRGCLEILKILIGLGVDTNVGGDSIRQETALSSATVSGCVDVVSYLLEHGAFVDNTGHGHDLYRFETPLQTACCYGHLRIAQLLIEAGADVNAPVLISGCHVLRSAALLGHVELLKLLLKQGVNLDDIGTFDYGPGARDRALVGFVAPSFAAQNGHQEAVDTLLAVVMEDYPGALMGAILAAARHGHMKLVEHLLTKHHDTILLDKGAAGDLKTVLQIAEESKSVGDASGAKVAVGKLIEERGKLE